MHSFLSRHLEAYLQKFSLSWICLCNRNSTAWVTRVTEIISSYLLEEAGKILDISHQASGAMWEVLLAKAALRGVRGQKKRRVCGMREHSFIQSMRMGSMWKGSGAMVGAMATDAAEVLLPTDEECPHRVQKMAVKTLLAVHRCTWCTLLVFVGFLFNINSFMTFLW